MYVFKNALRSISRAKGRNILVGIIVLVIAISTCVALSIRESAAKAKESTLEAIEITAQISVDRQAMMKNSTSSSGTPDPSAMRNAFSGASSLTLDQMLTYAKAESVKNFYYTLTTSLNGSTINPIDTTSSTTSSSSSSTTNSNSKGMPQSGQGGFGRMGVQGDFTVIGYSTDTAMTTFVKGTTTITSGAIFDEGTKDNVCVISDELALYNSLKVGDSITLVNPNNTNETFNIKIVGIYNNSQSTVTSGNTMGGFSVASDPANEIYMSYNALKALTTTSTTNATTTTDTNGNSTSTALREQVSGTYTFASLEDYNSFEAQAREMGLTDTYTISSSDVANYEQSIQPLENLSKFATYFLIVVLIIGGIILIVLNIFNIRDRKYEIGVLTAIGMKKHKVSLQFISELFVVTFACIIIGTGVGAGVSVPITNSLLKAQVTAQQEAATSQTTNFGRNSANGAANNGAAGNGTTSKGTANANVPSGSNMGGPFGSVGTTTVNYISEVSSATNFVVILQLMGIGIILTLVSSLAGVVFVLRYEPLKILTNRD